MSCRCSLRDVRVFVGIVYRYVRVFCYSLRVVRGRVNSLRVVCACMFTIGELGVCVYWSLCVVREWVLKSLRVVRMRVFWPSRVVRVFELCHSVRMMIF